MSIHVIWNADLSELLDMKLEDMLCKHVLNIVSDKSRKLLEASKNIGYPGCVWGYYTEGHSTLSHQLGIIEKMERDDYTHSIRVVICKYDHSDKTFIWTDNLHTTIKAIREKGRDARLRDVPFYVVDLSDQEEIKVYDYKKALINKQVLGAVNAAVHRFERSNSKEITDVGYTVRDFLEDNPGLLR